MDFGCHGKPGYARAFDREYFEKRYVLLWQQMANLSLIYQYYELHSRTLKSLQMVDERCALPVLQINVSLFFT